MTLLLFAGKIPAESDTRDKFAATLILRGVPDLTDVQAENIFKWLVRKFNEVTGNREDYSDVVEMNLWFVSK